MRARSWMSRASIVALASLGIGITGNAAPRAQAPVPRQPTLTSPSLAGADSYALYCASCHGSGGRGDGVMAASLRVRPPDLTTIARRNGGAFPFETVRQYIAGERRLAAHGSGTMPIWGDTFRALDPSDARVQTRIDNLTSFIQGVQVSSGLKVLPTPRRGGAALFRVHCGACHGDDARGGGVAAVSLRTIPPDLTRLAAGNGGTFPAERVRQIVLGEGPAAHGPRDMPLWRDLVAGPDIDTAAIDAIVTYVAGVQERAGE